MARRRRYLVALELLNADSVVFVAEVERRLTGCPAAMAYTDAEAEQFLTAAQYVDTVDAKTLADRIRRARIAFPTELAFDPYRLGRHIFRRWQEPVLRQTFLHSVVDVDYSALVRLKRKGDMKALVDFVGQFGAPAIFHMMRQCGMAEMIPEVEAAFSPEQAAVQRALFQFGKLTLHRFLTEPEPARQPSRWEQRKLIRRIHLREVQVRTLRRSLLSLRRERKALLARLRAAERLDHQELTQLAAELDQFRTALAESERDHVAALEAGSRQHQEAIARALAEVAAAEHDYQQALAYRNAWLSMAGGDLRGAGLAVSVSKSRLGYTAAVGRGAARLGSGRRRHTG